MVSPSGIRNPTRTSKPLATVILAYGLLTCVLTFPAVLDMVSRVPAGTDSWQNVWNFWWTKRALSHQDESLLWTRSLFHPTGVRLTLTNMTFLFSVPSVLLQAFATPEFALNLFLLITVMACALCMYALAREIRVSHTGAFVAGLVFAFSPVRMTNTLAGQLDTSAAFGLPLCALCYLRFARKGGWRPALCLSAVLVTTALASWYLVVIAAVLIVTFVVYDLLTRTRWTSQWRAWVNLGSSFVLAIVVLLPLMVSMFGDACLEGESVVPADLGLHSSVDVVSFFLPDPGPVLPGSLMRISGWHLFVPGELLENVYEHLGSVRLSRSAFTGYFVIVAAAVVVFSSFKSVTRWLGLGAVGAVLSLGPRLQLLGSESGIWMPHVVFGFVPGLKLMRCPQRFAFLYLLAVSILAGMAIDLSKRKMLPQKSRVLAILLIGCIVVEFAMVPNELLKAAVKPSSVLEHLVASGDAPVLNVPVANTREAGWFASRYLYFQRFHGRPMLFGYTSRHQGEDLYGLSERFPLLQALSVAAIFGDTLEARERSASESGFRIESASFDAVQIFRELRIGFIVLHRDLLGENSSRQLNEAFEGWLGAPVAEDASLALYALGPFENAQTKQVLP